MANGRRLFSLFLVLVLAIGSASARAEPQSDILIQRIGALRHSDLPEMLEIGVIRVLVSPTRTDFFIDRG